MTSHQPSPEQPSHLVQLMALGGVLGVIATLWFFISGRSGGWQLTTLLSGEVIVVGTGLIARAWSEAGGAKRDLGDSTIRFVARSVFRLSYRISRMICTYTVFVSFAVGVIASLCLLGVDFEIHDKRELSVVYYLVNGVVATLVTAGIIVVVWHRSLTETEGDPNRRLDDDFFRQITKVARPDNEELIRQILFHDAGPIDCVAIAFRPLTAEGFHGSPHIYDLLGLAEPGSRQMSAENRALKVLLVDPTLKAVVQRARRISGQYRRNYLRPVIRAMLSWARFVWSKPYGSYISSFDLKILGELPATRIMISASRVIVMGYRWLESGDDGPLRMYTGQDCRIMYEKYKGDFDRLWERAVVPGNLATGRICHLEHLQKIARALRIRDLPFKGERELLRLICEKLDLIDDYDKFVEAERMRGSQKTVPIPEVIRDPRQVVDLPKGSNPSGGPAASQIAANVEGSP